MYGVIQLYKIYAGCVKLGPQYPRKFSFKKLRRFKDIALL